MSPRIRQRPSARGVANDCVVMSHIGRFDVGPAHAPPPIHLGSRVACTALLSSRMRVLRVVIVLVNLC